MKKRLAVIIIIGILILTTGCSESENKTSSSNGQLTQEQKLKDFDYMYKILKDNYPYFEVNKRLNGVDWLANKNKYIAQIEATKNDKAYYETLSNILRQLNNGHTNLLIKDEYLYTKKLYEKLGNKEWLDQFNKAAAVKRYSTMQGLKNKSKAPRSYEYHNNVKTSILEENKLAYMAIHSLNSFNVNGDKKTIKPFLESVKNYKALIIDIRGNGGGDTAYWTNNIVSMLLNKPVKYTTYLAFRGGSFEEKFIKRRLGEDYYELNKTSDLDDRVLTKLPSEVKKDFKYYKEYNTELIPRNPIGFNGKIYMLIDGDVFSASESFAVFAKSTGFATLVGEKTGGDGIGMDPAVCTLPNSGYVFRFPVDMGLTSDGTCNFEHKTEPDIKVSAKVGATFSDDEAIKTVLKLIN